MENMSTAPVGPLKSTDSAPVGKLKSSGISGTSFSDALARVQDKSATTNAASPALTLGNANINALFAPTSTTTAPAHFRLPTAKIGALEEGLHERALALRAYRQQLLASNIANADTPGYKAVDIDIHEALRTGKDINSVQVKYVTPSQGSVDGNTVEMDIERVKFMENAIMYEYEVDRVRGHYKDMEELLKTTPY
ncbi:flagellar basal body protein [Undibacterium sp.]|uniref:flagellar basal body rod protein FlgB n=1 Tax=Undibacterium sp. TaxID=1914977 RepID=UPI0025D5B50C|nr:flagellar basal body protein [Undibacterium sp.]